MDDESQEQRYTRIRSLWDKLDVQNEGALDVKALKRGLKKLDHPLQNADDLIGEVLQEADINHDGRIQFDEFLRFVSQTEAQLWGMFKTIDKDNNGKLDKAELRSAFTRAGLAVPNARLDRFFDDIDSNNDGSISFDEWRDFLLFMPPHTPGLKAVLSYYQSAVKVTSEGDVSLSDETITGLGTTASFLTTHLFGAIIQIASPADSRQGFAARFDDSTSVPMQQDVERQEVEYKEPRREVQKLHTPAQKLSVGSVLTEFVPDPGYFIAGGISGVASRTTTAPLDRLKVYLIAQTGPTSDAVNAAKSGAPLQASKHGANTLVNACKELWAAGGIRSLFAGNGINIVKVMPESAVKFGSYEASKRVIAKIEGHTDAKNISHVSQFIAGGVAGMISQAVVYPLDTLKFRMQNEVVKGGQRGNALIFATARKMWAQNGLFSFYRGLSMGLVGMFPYAAIDLGTFEYLKRKLTARRVQLYGGHQEDVSPGNFTLAIMGGFSGAIGASAVYPVNLLRTRLQCQGTVSHPRTYTGIVDVTRQTLQGEGVRGLFKGLTPNLLKVIPAVSITYVVYENTKKALHLQ